MYFSFNNYIHDTLLFDLKQEGNKHFMLNNIYLYSLCDFFFLPDSTFGNMANHYQATFKGVRFGEVPSVQILHQSVTRSLITCSVICLRDFQTCRSFTYESQSNKCSLYSEIYTISSDFIRSPGHTYYVLLSYV